MAQRIVLAKRLVVLGTLMATGLAAQVLTTLVAFKATNGSNPSASLVQGTDGNLYGTTIAGGANSNGTVFKLTLTGVLTTLYSFCAQANCADGANPSATLLLGTDGNFYGTTVSGGSSSCQGGCGSTFQITPSGTLKTLHSFVLTDGAYPYGALVQATDGNFYGTTYSGGKNNFGTIFKISSAGALTTMHNFAGFDGASPLAGLIQATDGNFYGTTYAGGTKAAGTAFRMNLSGMYARVHSFCVNAGCPDGAAPSASLVQGTDGNLYGTTQVGGANNDGTVFQITLKGLTTLHSFAGSDGSTPTQLMQATDGNFYGITVSGGSSTACNSGCGTIYKTTSAGVLTTEYNFDSTHGASPQGLMQETNGTFYGTGLLGTGYGDGTVFSFSIGLGFFVETNPASGAVGTSVTILGTALTGAHSVTFNGIAATYTVVSATQITTTVPAGAATGPVTVVAGGKTLTGKVLFRVP